ncbi:MAG: SH3 domain-containing protein [Lawsonibacter sp.]|nr:SH3 domain-containing protein [Lawsonibacter sp.]
MKPRAKRPVRVALLLSALLLLAGLAACRRGDRSLTFVYIERLRSQTAGLLQGEPYVSAPEESAPEELTWDPEYRLELAVPELQGELELPIQGATGYTTVVLNLWEDSARRGEILDQLAPGTAFTVLEEEGDWWLVQTQAHTGWVEHRFCMVNLPDVIPSIVYNDTNAYSSVFLTSGKDIPGITGQALYSARAYNPRLDREEFIMPVLYAMSKRICQAQQAALAEGNTLVLYEGYRPYETQLEVSRAVASMAKTDPEVQAGINSAPWSIGWFIATDLSNHQWGFAIDVSLARVTQARTWHLDGRVYLEALEYQEYTMPTPIHELSQAAVTFTAPVNSFSANWRSAALAESMRTCQPAMALQGYCTGAELSPLASEWWHFNDLQAWSQVRGNLGKGGYTVSECRSLLPQEARALAGLTQ